MFTRSTVLVLGAGASKPLQFPTGEELTKQIITQSAEGHGLYEFLKKSISGNSSLISLNKFSAHLRKADLPSIDKFLEYRPEFEEIGKLAIAYKIIQYENGERLHNRGEDDWYRMFFHELASEGIDAIPNNKVALVTFNYDRSLEEYLFNAIKQSKGMTDKDARQIINTIPTIHIYGSVGPLPWQVNNADEFNLPYGIANSGSDTTRAVQDASDKIRLISDRTNPAVNIYEKAQKLIEEAEKVHFLGFGFEKTNMERLKLIWQSNMKSKYSGTSYGLGKNRQKALEEISLETLKLHPCKIKEYIHDKEAF